MLTRRFVVLAGLSTPALAFGQDFPPVTQAQLDSALQQAAAQTPHRYDQLGARTDRFVRRGNAVYQYFEKGRVRILQDPSGELRLPKSAVELDSDKIIVRRDKDDRNSSNPPQPTMGTMLCQITRAHPHGPGC